MEFLVPETEFEALCARYRFQRGQCVMNGLITPGIAASLTMLEVQGSVPVALWSAAAGIGLWACREALTLLRLSRELQLARAFAARSGSAS